MGTAASGGGREGGREDTGRGCRCGEGGGKSNQDATGSGGGERGEESLPTGRGMRPGRREAPADSSSPPSLPHFLLSFLPTYAPIPSAATVPPAAVPPAPARGARPHATAASHHRPRAPAATSGNCGRDDGSTRETGGDRQRPPPVLRMRPPRRLCAAAARRGTEGAMGHSCATCVAGEERGGH